MKNREEWEDQFDRITEANDGRFGHNVEFGGAKYAKKYISKLDGAGAGLCKIEVINEYTIRVTLPYMVSTDVIKYRENTLLYLLTEDPKPSECRFNSKKDQLTVEWHY